MTDNREKSIAVKNALDMTIVGENILDIAEFAVEKYEFRQDTKLPSETRKAAIEGAQATLWETVEKLKLKRQEILKTLFDQADETVQKVISDHN